MALSGQLKRLGKHSAIYGLGGLVSRILAVLLLPLYTHYLSTSDYGQIETLIALVTVLTIVLQFGISSAFFRFYFDADDHDGRRLVLRTSFWFTMTMATLGLVVLVAFAPQIADWLFGECRRREPRPRERGRALGAAELHAADEPVPGRGALGRVRAREPLERPPHGRRDARCSSSCSTRARSGSSSATSWARWSSTSRCSGIAASSSGSR